MSRNRRAKELLSQVHVAKPCPADWTSMHGDESVRHCTHCAKNVYNISNMSRQEAAALIQKNEGHLCVRYYTRTDGSIMTSDCGRAVKVKRRMFALLASILGIFGLGAIVPAFQRPTQGALASKSKVYFTGDVYNPSTPGQYTGFISTPVHAVKKAPLRHLHQHVSNHKAKKAKKPQE